MSQEKHQLPDLIESLSDKEKIKLIRSLIPIRWMCQNILANGETCEKIIEDNKVECISCYRKKMRKPSNISSEEWILIKERRVKARKDKNRERMDDNRKRMEELMKSKKLKRY